MAPKHKPKTTFPEIVTIGNTKGTVYFSSQQPYGLRAEISVTNVLAPELPLLQMTDDAGWVYQNTGLSLQQDVVHYTFVLDEKDADKLRSVVWFFDTLYG